MSNPGGFLDLVDLLHHATITQYLMYDLPATAMVWMGRGFRETLPESFPVVPRNVAAPQDKVPNHTAGKLMMR